jgi:phosphohistidine swiveling domain-containing protein
MAERRIGSKKNTERRLGMSYGYDIIELKEPEDIDMYKVWILDAAHWLPCPHPLFYHGMGQHLWRHPYHLSVDWIDSPLKRGSGWRSYKGYCYITADPTTDEEQKQREPIFREKMTKFLKDPWEPWNMWKEELKARYNPLMDRNVEQMKPGELAGHLWDVWEINRRVWEIHMLGWTVYSEGLAAFRDMAAEMAGLHYTDPLYARLMSGFDNDLFRLNRGLADLATKALKLKLEDTFKLPDEQVLPGMEQAAAGKEWLAAFNKFLYKDGFRGQGWRMQNMLEYCTPTWFEKPYLAVADIRRLMGIGGTHTPDMQIDRLAKDRKEAEKEILAKIPAAEREWFQLAMRYAQAAQVYCEEHDYWCEFRGFSLVRLAAIETGKRLVKAGVFEDPEDAMDVLMDDLVLGAAGLERNAAIIKPRLKANKEEFLHNRTLFDKGEIPMIKGDPSFLPYVLGRDTMLNVQISQQLAKPEEVGATCVGAAGSPGVVEGIARLIMTPDDWPKLQSGDILVAPITMATWTPLFSTIKAVVTDAGGMLSHPVIVGREYGIPAVAGCGDATRKIKDGDKIKVDGNQCRVWVL